MAEKKKPRYALWAIMLLLCVGLLGFGTGGFNGNARTIGSVGDKDLTTQSYQNALNQQISAFEAQVGSRIGFADAQALGLVNAAQAQLIRQRALDNEATNLGISVGDERVRSEVLRVPAFRGLDGQFDREAYRSALQRNGLTEGAFETGIREDVARTLLQASIVGGIPDQTTYTETLLQFVGETRDFVWAPIDEDQLVAAIATPTDADLQAYYTANPAPFTLPEAREISYVWLTPDMIQDTLDVDESTLRALYEDRISEYVRPERRLVERLVYVDTPAAEAAIARINSGALDFDALVAERGLSLSDIDLGDVSADDLGPAAEAVFAANPGDVVGPLDTTVGPALFRMNAVLAAEEIPFEDASDTLRIEVSADRARRVIDDAAEGINDLMAGGATLEDLANDTDMEFGTISMTPETRSDIAAYETFRTAAANAELGDFLELDNLADGGIFALQLDGITEPQLQPLEDVRDDVVEAWTAAETQIAIMARAEEIAATIQPLTDFASLGLTPTAETGLTRRSFIEGTPPGFMLSVFETNLSETGVVDAGRGALVFRVDAISPPDADDPAAGAERDTINNSVRAGISQDIFEAYSNAVQVRTDVVLDQAIINALHSHLQ